MSILSSLSVIGPRAPGSLLRHVRHLASGSHKKKGAPPGTVVYVGTERAEPARISFMDYDGDVFSEGGRADERTVSLDEVLSVLDGPRTTWVNLDGIHEVEMVQGLADHLGIHRLVQEDIVHSSQRAKLEEYPDHLYLVMRMLHWDAESASVQDEQLSLVLGQGAVLTFQERRGDVFEGVRDRLRTGKGTIRSRGADYLAYALIDSVVDHYFHIIEAISDHVEALEPQVLEDPSPEALAAIHRLRREMLVIRRGVWPLRDLLSQLYRDESGFIGADTRVFLRDVYDHAVQVVDTVETLRDLVGGLMDLYLTGVSNRMNEVMKVLTIIATIFIPLSFLAGLYGMNFDSMPELHQPWGYPGLLLVMAAVAGAMLLFFRRKGWL
ncbi:MAG: magnesium/cobalt transporter CorA [Gemmatimonadales bacterium]|jgi:magnesium transporter|nr:MAG: magnesium/cobalt transporter CorA [Gemmatimonadales bacterium]